LRAMGFEIATSACRGAGAVRGGHVEVPGSGRGPPLDLLTWWLRWRARIEIAARGAARDDIVDARFLDGALPLVVSRQGSPQRLSVRPKKRWRVQVGQGSAGASCLAWDSVPTAGFLPVTSQTLGHTIT